MRISRRIYFYHFLRDVFIVAGSIALAIFLVKAGAVEKFLDTTSGFKIVASFIAGMFFTTVFTVAPATIALIALAKSFSPVYVGLIGAFGAMLIDFAIFRFFRDKMSRDASGAFTQKTKKRLQALFRYGFLKWFFVLVGGLIIASPLPDELGLALFGLAKIKNSLLLPLLFVMNFLGILIIVSLGNVIMSN